MAGLDLLLILGVLASLPLCVARPWIGILIYTWLSFMHPFRLVGGLAFGFPLVKLVAGATLVGLLFTRQRYRLPWRRETALVAALLALFTATTWMTAIEPVRAQAKWAELVKIIGMSAAALVLLQNRRKLRLWLLVIALSFGFFGVTGGVWGLWTRLDARLFGPPDTWIHDNNSIGFVFTMVLPLLAFLHFDEERQWLRHLLLATFGLTIVAVVATYSRASLIGLVIVSALLLLLIRARDKPLLIAGLAACVAIYFAPQQWVERMQTITPTAYRVDGSGVERMHSWYVAWRLGLDHPLLGAGFHPFSPRVYEQYIPGYFDAHDSHNHFLQTLAEHGFTGLLLFTGLLATVWWSLLKTAWSNWGDPERVWIVRYAQMLMVSFVAYVVGGVFINQPHSELLYFLIIAALLLDEIAASPGGEGPAPVGTSLIGAVFRWRPR